MNKPLGYGRYCHVYNRGNNRENIFVEARNYHYFLELYAKQIVPVADTYAYCLLKNHFHLLIRTKTVTEQTEYWRNLPDAEKELSGSRSLTALPDRGDNAPNLTGLAGQPLQPSQRFSNLFNAYTKAMNHAYGRIGALFQRPFGRVEVTTDAHFRRLVAYIHRNAQQHGFVDDFRQWPYPSYHALLSFNQTNLHREEVLTWFHGHDGFHAVHGWEIPHHQILSLVPEEFE